jgi:uncharacterized protein (DUF608 family)
MMKIIAAAVLFWLGIHIGNAQNKFEHMIAAEKQLTKEWKQSLLDRGSRKVYRGSELTTIGMPVSGIASGQLYVRGDGTLACWWIANNAYNTGPGRSDEMNFETPHGPWQVCYQTFEPFSYFKQGFEVEVETGKKKIRKELNKTSFNDVQFIGEYPIAKIKYESTDFKLPVSIQMDVFSPFIPHNLRASANPATVLKFKVRNNTKRSVKVKLTGFIQNMVMADLKEKTIGKIRNTDRSIAERSSLFMDFLPSNSKDSHHPYFGNMSLSLLSKKGVVNTGKNNREEISKELGEELIGSVAGKVQLKAGEEKELSFLLTWFFPNRPMDVDMGWDWNKPIKTKGLIRGNMYANWYNSSLDVADYFINNSEELIAGTYTFHKSWYEESSLPYWLKQRILMPASILATETVQWYADNKFMFWEGVGSCYGNCTHVYNYAQATAHLFPSIERSIREKSDFGVSFQKDGGILSRDGRERVFMDGHLGAILKAYREHLMSKDNIFLLRNWKKIKKAMEHAIKEDGNDDGLMETTQSNTYDIHFSGANTYVGSLYLAALKASEQMAKIIGDVAFENRCRKIAESGREQTEKRLWNGHYFIQDVDLKKHPKFQYAKGCLSDQLFGQTWSYLLALGDIYSSQKIDSTFNSIWRYNWTKDVGAQAKKYTPERDYATAGEPGLFICTWPLSKHLNKNGVRYRNEVWTGIEYQVATGMIYNGMLEEGLSLVKGVHERYRPEKHNPWNEIECGDHYGRAMASWGILKALEGFHYDGPKGLMTFSPNIQKDNFNGFFSSANAWGNITQKMVGKKRVNIIEVKYGELDLNELIFDKWGSDLRVELNGTPLKFQFANKNTKVKLFDLALKMRKGDKLEIIF